MNKFHHLLPIYILFGTKRIFRFFRYLVDKSAHREVHVDGTLAGEIRPISRIEQRISEAEKLGFKQFLLPRHNLQGLNTSRLKIELIPVRKVEEAFRQLFG